MPSISDAEDRLDRVCQVLGGCRPSGSRRALRCPAHDDRHASLTAWVGDQGAVLFKCHAGCQFGDIAAAAIARGLDRSVLYPPSSASGGVAEARYVYSDADGTVVARKVRWKGARGRRFSWEAPDGTPGLKGIRPPLYRLPAVLAAVSAGGQVWVVEGERDADMAAGMGLAATTSPHGAGRGKWRPAYTDVLAGATVAVVADHDDTGLVYAREVADALRDAGCAVTVLRPPQAGHDLSDHMAAGRSIADLEPATTTTKPHRLEDGRWPFVMLPDNLDMLTPLALKALYLLDRHQERHGPWQGRNGLAAQLGVGRGITDDVISELVKNGFVTMEHHGQKRMTFVVNNPSRDPKAARRIEKQWTHTGPPPQSTVDPHRSTPPKTVDPPRSTGAVLAGLRSESPSMQVAAEATLRRHFGNVKEEAG